MCGPLPLQQSGSNLLFVYYNIIPRLLTPPIAVMECHLLECNYCIASDSSRVVSCVPKTKIGTPSFGAMQDSDS